MEELINIMNQLQDVFNSSGIQDFDLPQIAVVGTQSSGKSSVLEHLVGRSFLPRGAGVVTRCPLLLQLVNSHDITEDYAIFQHKKNEVFTDYQLITQEIIDQTELLTGGDRGICSTPISLKMHSPSFSNLTLVDLPGITKVPVGNQPENIEQVIKDLIHEYIDRPNCIILVVTPANADMATCEGLKIAREVDPDGVRTLVVVTKLDLMDQGTDARAMLSGSVIPVKLGIIGVVNRSQKGINENKSMKQSLKDEIAFFNKYYKEMATFHGTAYLTKTVQSILISHIEQCLPELKEQIGKKLHEHKLELTKFSNTETNKSTLLPDIIFKLCKHFCANINGTLDNIDTKNLNGGGRIYKIFTEANEKLEQINPLTDLSQNEVLIAHRNSFGVKINDSKCYAAFEFLVKKQLKQIIYPSLKCVDLVHKELSKIIQSCVDDPEFILQSYPCMQHNLSSAASALLENRLDITKTMVNHIFEIHSSYIIDDEDSPSPLENDKDAMPDMSAVVSKLSNKEISIYVSTVKKIKRYFSKVKKSFMDMLPKIIMCFMVNYLKDHLHSELMSRLSNIEDCLLLQESSESLEKKEKIRNSILALEKANGILYSLRHSNRLSFTNISDKITTPSNATENNNTDSEATSCNQPEMENAQGNHYWIDIYNILINGTQNFNIRNFLIALILPFAVASLVYWYSK